MIQHHFFYYVYILKSRSFDEIYIRSTNNLLKRFDAHNIGMNISTRRYTPWKLMYYEAYREEKIARKAITQETYWPSMVR